MLPSEQKPHLVLGTPWTTYPSPKSLPLCRASLFSPPPPTHTSRPFSESCNASLRGWFLCFPPRDKNASHRQGTSGNLTSRYSHLALLTCKKTCKKTVQRHSTRSRPPTAQGTLNESLEQSMSSSTPWQTTPWGSFFPPVRSILLRLRLMVPTPDATCRSCCARAPGATERGEQTRGREGRRGRGAVRGPWKTSLREAGNFCEGRWGLSYLQCRKEKGCGVVAGRRPRGPARRDGGCGGGAPSVPGAHSPLQAESAYFLSLPSSLPPPPQFRCQVRVDLANKNTNPPAHTRPTQQPWGCGENEITGYMGKISVFQNLLFLKATGPVFSLVRFILKASLEIQFQSNSFSNRRSHFLWVHFLWITILIQIRFGFSEWLVR